MTFQEIAVELSALLEQKNLAYGNSFAKTGQILELLFPAGVRSDQYHDMLVIVRILDKLSRIAHDPTAFQEDPWKDIAGYALLQLHLKQAGK